MTEALSDEAQTHDEQGGHEEALQTQLAQLLGDVGEEESGKALEERAAEIGHLSEEDFSRLADAPESDDREIQNLKRHVLFCQLCGQTYLERSLPAQEREDASGSVEEAGSERGLSDTAMEPRRFPWGIWSGAALVAFGIGIFGSGGLGGLLAGAESSAPSEGKPEAAAAAATGLLGLGARTPADLTAGVGVPPVGAGLAVAGGAAAAAGSPPEAVPSERANPGSQAEAQPELGAEPAPSALSAADLPPLSVAPAQGADPEVRWAGTGAAAHEGTPHGDRLYVEVGLPKAKPSMWLHAWLVGETGAVALPEPRGPQATAEVLSGLQPGPRGWPLPAGEGWEGLVVVLCEERPAFFSTEAAREAVAEELSHLLSEGTEPRELAAVFREVLGRQKATVSLRPLSPR